MLAVVGPTASGKTWLGVKLAQRYGGEVISADSMQIYKGMDIASAKPNPEEMEGIPHHLIGFLDRTEDFSVADYVRIARRKTTEVLERGNLPIIVGGTGLYVSSLLDDIKFDEGVGDTEYRDRLYEYAEKNGKKSLHDILAEVDPESAEKIHPNNLVRVVRALEVYYTTGQKFSQIKVLSKPDESPYDSLIIGLDFRDRQVLYDRIDRRVDEMLERGLVREAGELWKETGMKTAANAIGYKELIPYFTGDMTLDACVEKIKRETRRYAKRQLTWFRKNTRIKWIILDEIAKKDEILEKSEKIIANHKIVCYNE